MKKLHTLFPAVFFFVLIQPALAQSAAPNWQPVFLNAAGSQSLYGVRVFYALEQCDGQDALILKFVNTNTYTVKAEWEHLMYRTSGEAVSGSDRKSLTINANGEVQGDCAYNATLKIILSEHGLKATGFSQYTAAYFTVSPVNEANK